MPHAAIPILVLAGGLAQAAPPSTATHARFLALIIGLVVAFLTGLALLTIVRMVHRRHAARTDRIAKVRTARDVPVSPWAAAGQRADPRDDGDPDTDEDDDDDPDDDDDDPDGEFGDDDGDVAYDPSEYEDEGEGDTIDEFGADDDTWRDPDDSAAGEPPPRPSRFT